MLPVASFISSARWARTLAVMRRKTIVVGTFGVLAVGTVAVWYRSSDLRCSIDQPCSQLMAVEGAIHMYMLDTGHVPENLDDLLSTSVPGSRGPYIVKGALIDPKGRPIDYGFSPNRAISGCRTLNPTQGLCAPVRAWPGAIPKMTANSAPHRDGREASHFDQPSSAPARGRER